MDDISLKRGVLTPSSAEPPEQAAGFASAAKYDDWCVMHDELAMRTTIAIDDDVLLAARAIADHERRTLGAVISDLARKALDRPQPRGSRNGVPLLAPSPEGAPVTLEIVNALRDELA